MFFLQFHSFNKNYELKKNLVSLLGQELKHSNDARSTQAYNVKAF